MLSLTILVILIILVVFVYYFIKDIRQENFNGGNGVSLITQCYENEVDDCTSSNCEVLSKTSLDICLNNTRCNQQESESNCNLITGCQYGKNIISTCEGKSEENCDENLCFWNGEKCFEKDAQYEKGTGYDICRSYNDNQTACNNITGCFFGSEWQGGEEKCLSVCRRAGSSQENCVAANTAGSCVYKNQGDYGYCYDRDNIGLESVSKEASENVLIDTSKNVDGRTPIENNEYNFENNQGCPNGTIFKPTYYSSWNNKFSGNCQTPILFCKNKSSISSFQQADDDNKNALFTKYENDFKDNCFQLPIISNYYNYYASSNEIPSASSQNANYLSKEFLDNVENLKLLPCVEIKRLYEYSKTRTDNDDDYTHAQKIINYIENADADSEIFSEDGNTKCNVLQSCTNSCSGKSEQNCDEDNCRWIDSKGICVRVHDTNDGTDAELNCTEEENCEDNSSCRREVEYEYNFCSPKTSCESGERLELDRGNISCQTCPVGTYLNSDGVCKNCDFNTYSEGGATECSDKTNCNSNQYVSIDSITENQDSKKSNLGFLTANQLNKILTDSRAMKDIVDLGSNRECKALEKCPDTDSETDTAKFVTDLNNNSNRNSQAYMKRKLANIKSLQDYIDTMSGYNVDSCQYNPPAPSPGSTLQVYSEDPIRFNNYQCTDLTQCDENQYISNYDDQKVKTQQMFTINRTCVESQNCQPGTYEETRESSEYPVIETIKDGEKYNVHTRDRNCSECEDLHYTDRENLSECTLQPTCGKGKKVIVELNDLLNGSNHKIGYEKSDFSVIEMFLRSVMPSTLSEERKNQLFIELGSADKIGSIDTFINNESSTNGQIKFISDDETFEAVLFEYTIEDNVLKLTSNSNIVTEEIVVSLDIEIPRIKGLEQSNTYILNILVKLDDESNSSIKTNLNIVLGKNYQVPKYRRISCDDCGQYTYRDNDEHRKIFCLDQPVCAFGEYYPGDPDDKDLLVECGSCADHTYTGPPDIKTPGHRVEECYPQPTLGNGECSIDYHKRFVEARMITKPANGETDYQDVVGHRNPCKDQTRCNKGELISSPDPISTRYCTDITAQVGISLLDTTYMDENNHRNMKAKENEKCLSGDLWICSGGDPRKKFEEKAECVEDRGEADLSC